MGKPGNAGLSSLSWLSAGNLHPLIKERLREMKRAQAPSSASGQYVLYCMHTAVRDHENPALDIARAEAAARKLPLVVASFLLGAKHTYPTHRRYKFLLEGLQDVQISFKAQAMLLPNLALPSG